jgi:hypothetical protein
MAQALVDGCRQAGLDVSRVLVTEALPVDPADALLYLAFASDCEVVAVEPPADHVRRFTAVAREGARRRPIVSLIGPGAATTWCRQAGVDPCFRLEDLVARCRILLSARRAGGWSAPRRGELAVPADCDIARARAVLDHDDRSGPDRDTGSVQLPPGPAGEVLAAYGIGVPDDDAGAVEDRSSLVLEARDGAGLVAGLQRPDPAAGSGEARLLPLTWCDAEELVAAAGPGFSCPTALVDSLVRAARLIDDQADVARVRLGLDRRVAGVAGAAVWTGAVRGTEDDPFVRRLPSMTANEPNARS